MLPQPLAAKAHQVSGRLYAQVEQLLLGYFAHAGNLPHRQRRQKTGFAAGGNPEHAVGFGLVGANLGHHARAADADRTVQPRGRLHAAACSRCAARSGGPCSRSVPLMSRYASSMEAISTSGENCRSTACTRCRLLAITLRMSVEKDRLRTQLGGRAQRHRRVHPELARRVRGGGHHAPLIRLPAHHHRLALQRRVVQLLDGDEESVHIDMEDGGQGQLSSFRFQVSSLTLQVSRFTFHDAIAILSWVPLPHPCFSQI